MTDSPYSTPQNVYSGSPYSTPPPPKPSYWEDPLNVEKFYQLARFTPPDQIPEWFNAGAINEAHNYYSSLPQNAGKEWWNYTAPENDEMAPVMADVPPPPKDILGGYEQYKSPYTNDEFYQFMSAKDSDPNGQAIMLDRNAISQLPENVQQVIVGSLGERDKYAIPATMAQQIQSMLPQQPVEQPKTMKDLQASGEWNNIPALDKLQIWAQSQKYAGAASGALQGVIPAGVQLLARNPAGAVASLAIAAGLGQGSQMQGIIGTISKNLMALFNIGAETVERSVGVTGQALGSALFPQWYGDFGELMKNLPEAWQAAAITYESANIGSLFGQMTQNTHQLGETDKTVINNYEDDALTSMYNLRRELEDVYEGRSPKSVDEVLFGYKESQNVVDRYVAKYGVEGQNRNLVLQLAADPINFAGAGIGKVGEKVFQKFGLEVLSKMFADGRYVGTLGNAISKSVQAFQEGGVKKLVAEPAFIGYKPMDAGMITTFKKYITDIKANPEKYKDVKIGKFFEVVGGISRDKDGNIVEYRNTPQFIAMAQGGKPQNFLDATRFLFFESPQSAFHHETTYVGDKIAHVAGIQDPTVSLDQSVGIINKVAEHNPMELKEMGIAEAGSTGLTQMFPQISKEVRPKADAYVLSYHGVDPQRQIVNAVGEASNTPSGKRLEAASTDPVAYLSKAIEVLSKDTDIDGKPKTPEQLKIDAEKLKQLQGIEPAQIKESADLMKQLKSPVTEADAKVEVARMWMSGVVDWTIKNYGLHEQGPWGKLADGVKNIESFFLLFPNALFAAQNTMTNAGHLFADQLLSSVVQSPAERARLWIRFGFTPERALAGVGDITRGGKEVGLYADMISETERMMKGKPMGLFAPLENLTGSIKRSLKGGMTSLSNKNEQWAANIAATSRADAVHRELAQIGRGIDPIAQGDRLTIGEDTSLAIENALNGSANEAEFWQKMGAGTVANLTPELKQKLADYGMLEEFEQKLLAAGNDKGKIRKAISEINNEAASRVSKAMLDNIEREAHDATMSIVRGDSQGAIPTVLSGLQSEHDFNMLNHQKILNEIQKERTKLGGTKGDKYYVQAMLDEDNRMKINEQIYGAKMLGAAHGLGVNAENAGVITNLQAAYANHSAYYDKNRRWWGNVSDIINKNLPEVEQVKATDRMNLELQGILGDKFDPLANPIENVRAALTQEYVNMTARESAIYDAINKPFMDKLKEEHENGYNAFNDLLNLQKANRKETVAAQIYFRTGEDVGVSKETKAQIDGILGDRTLNELRSDKEDRQAWQRFQDEVYTPLWYKNVDAEHQAHVQAWYQAQGMMPGSKPKVEVQPEVPTTVDRYEPIRTLESIWDTLPKDKQEIALVEIAKQYGYKGLPNIRSSINKRTGSKLTNKDLVTPSMLRQALESMTPEEFATHWAGSGDGMKANTLSPAPEQMQTVLTPPVYQPQVENYAKLKAELLQWQTDHIDSPVQIHPGTNLDNLTPEQRTVVSAILADRFRQIKDVNWTAAQHGVAARDFALLNYNDRSRFDNTLTMFMPYHFWYTHSMMNWAIRALDRPGLMATYAKLKNYGNNIQEDPNQPSRLKGKVFIPMPWLPESMGNGLYVDPLRNIIPLDNFLKPIQQWDQNQTQQYKSAVSIIQDMVDNENVTYDDALNAIKNKSGDLWDTAWSKAGAQLDSPGIMDYAQMLYSPHMPISWLIKAAGGHSDTISQLPFTRTVQNITGGLGIASDKDLFGGLISPAGVNLEAWPRKALGLPMIDKFADYRVERELSIMSSEDPSRTSEAIQAMIDKKGQMYNEAVRRTMGQSLAKYGGAQLAMDFLPEGEMGQRKLREPYAKAADAYANGDTTALNTFFSAHPEYAAQQALWRKPDSRMMMYLKSLVWEQYNALPDLQKKEFADQAGSLFQDAFLNKQTRSYASISNETYATWAQALGAMIPETANPSQLKVNYSDPQIVKDYQTFKDMKDQYFPNISEMQNYANTLPKDQQAQFYQQNPIMGQYSAFRDQYMAQYPEVAKAWQQDGSDLAGLPNSAIQAVYQFRADKEKLFPNIDEITNYYFSLPDAAQKRAFMLDHPEIENFWSWRTSIAANNPQAAYHIIGADSLGNSIRGQFNVEEAFPGIYDMQNEYFSYPKGSQARKNFLSGHPTLNLYWDWKGLIGDETQMEAQFAKEYVMPILTNASGELKNQLSGYYYAGQPLTQGALAELQSLFVQSGQIGGNLNTFVGLLKTGF